jgi:hypothetical protein
MKLMVVFGFNRTVPIGDDSDPICAHKKQCTDVRFLRI